MSRLSILGLYHWDETIFDDMNIPSGLAKGRVISAILDKGAELELVYPDANTMKEMINLWSLKQAKNWELLNQAFNTDYNLLGKSEVYDSTEKMQSQDDGSGNSKGDTKHSKAGFNSATMADATSDESNLDSTTKNQHQEQAMRGYTKKYYGSLGLHTSTDLLEAEIRFRREWNIYDVIAEDFKERFCLLVY